ncbi:PspC domain-containing protein [Cellulomonas sp. P24]|uniref:PspC domain-containing protein n=1 Tax=Cellulomonas sp. P24 TaxID=2885206 RepID=UPI00216AC954|nr:PspC domain-containing protein [Cellulomonas sp. P24]MCR6492195.1 PspC domain-containing protein [Cellulomonas sp. P24]
MESTTPPTGPGSPAPSTPPPTAGAYGPYGPYRSSPPPPSRPGSDGFFDAMRRIGVVRTEARWMGGVAGGIARRFGIDPLLVRGIFAASLLLGGVGFVVYGLGWALLPEESDGRIHLQETIRGRFDIGLLGAVAMLLLGLNSGSGMIRWFGWGTAFQWFNAVLWIAAIAVIIALVIAASGQRHRPEATMSTPSSIPPDAGGTPTGEVGPEPGPAPAPAPAPSSGAPWSTTNAFGPFAAEAAPTAATTVPIPAPPVPTPGPAPEPPAGPYSTGRFSGRTYPSGGYGAYAPPAPPRPPRPRRPVARGAGPAATGTVLALGLLSLAWLMLSERAGVFDGPVLLTATGITIVLAGVGIVVAGLLGRRGGGLGAIAVLGILLSIPLGLSTTSRVPWYSTWVAFGQESYQPTDVSAASGGYSVFAGDLRIDLTSLPVSAADPVTVPVSVGAGNVTIVVPRDVPVTATTHTLAGQVDWLVDGSRSSSTSAGVGHWLIDGSGSSSSAGVGQARTWESAEVRAGEPAEIVLDIHVNAGQITIEEAS